MSTNNVETVQKVNALLQKVYGLLRSPVPVDNAQAVVQHVASVDALNYTVGYYKSCLQESLTRLEHESLPSKEDGGPMQERILAMKDAVAPTQKVVDLLENAGQAIRQRVTLCQSILRFMEGEMRNKLGG